MDSPSSCAERGRRILVVDDDEGIRSLIAGYLDRNGFDTRTAADASQMRDWLEREPCDLIVLDLMMPGEDGVTALRRLQQHRPDQPVIMLSAVGSDIDRIVGLELGADDYLPKPCNPRELLARIRTVLRRRGEPNPARAIDRLGMEIAEVSGWSIHLLARTARRPNGQFLHLTDGEFTLLRAFVEHPNRVLTRDQLLDHARGSSCEFYDRAIDVQVSRLRRKMGARNFIRTIRNEGYMFVP